jgi:hypothetical protein
MEINCTCQTGQPCTSCGSCADAQTGLTVIDVTEVVIGQQALNVGDVLTGYKGDSPELCAHIRKDFTYVGNGICRNKKKRVDIYVNQTESNTFYGVSTVLDYRYFSLVRTG